MATTAEIDAVMRGPDAYKVAARALDAMTRLKVWPTPINYELWLNAFTDNACQQLAETHLPRSRTSESIRETGEKLTVELDTVSQAIQAAHQSTEVYGGVLADAGAELEGGEPTQLRQLISGLSDATRQAEHQARLLQRQLEESTGEIAKLRDSLAEVRRDAATDALTGLANRKAFDAALERAVADSGNASRPVALAVLDIDHFKTFNDTWGHQTGDQVLRFVAQVIGRSGHHPRVAARYGGEEFAILFPGETARSVDGVLTDVLKEIASRTLRRRSTNDELGTITVSAGLAELNGAEGAVALLERADAALYASKRNGRNRVTNAGKTMVEAA